MSIEIANESGVDVDEPLLAGLARHVLDDMRVHPLAELSVLLVDEPAMTELHVRWMGEDGPDRRAGVPDGRAPARRSRAAATAITARPTRTPPMRCSVTWSSARRWRRRRPPRPSTTSQDEIDLLCTHGILHLLGYDHAEPEEHATMFGLQDRLLASWRAERGRSGGARPPTAGAARAGGPRPGSEGAGDGTVGWLLVAALALMLLAGWCTSAETALLRAVQGRRQGTGPIGR